MLAVNGKISIVCITFGRSNKNKSLVLGCNLIAVRYTTKIEIIMKIFILFKLIFVIAFASISYSSEKNIDSTSIDEIYRQPKYEKWIQYWKTQIPEVENIYVENIYKMKWREPHKVNLDKWIESKKNRKYTLDYSNNNNFVTDEYAYIDFENINDTVYMFGTAVDAYFEVANLRDSVVYHITLFPTCFFGESIWLSDSLCCILGFSYDTYGATEYYKGYC